MGKRGRTSNNPAGFGTTNDKGYHRIRVDGRYRLAHRVEWERYYGPVPPGYDIHHLDHDKFNNDISNLQIVDKTTHKRLHGGCYLEDGLWWKPCKLCGQFKPLTVEHWYMKDGSPLYGQRCSKCHNADIAKRQREKRAAAAESAPPKVLRRRRVAR